MSSELECYIPNLVDHVDWWLERTTRAITTKVCTFFDITPINDGRVILGRLTIKGIPAAAIAAAMESAQRASIGHEFADITAEELHAARLVDTVIRNGGSTAEQLVECLNADLSIPCKSGELFQFACHFAKKRGKNTVSTLRAACIETGTAFPAFPARSSTSATPVPSQSIVKEYLPYCDPTLKARMEKLTSLGAPLTQEQREDLFWDDVQQVILKCTIREITSIVKTLSLTHTPDAHTEMNLFAPVDWFKTNNISPYAVVGCFYCFAPYQLADEVKMLASKFLID